MYNCVVHTVGRFVRWWSHIAAATFSRCESCLACSNQVCNNSSRRYCFPCLQALSPHYAYYYFRDNRHLGWVQCSGLFLAITGNDSMPVLEDEMCWLMQLLFCVTILCCVIHTLRCEAITGTEATYADLGHFSRPAIRVSATMHSWTQTVLDCAQWPWSFLYTSCLTLVPFLCSNAYFACCCCTTGPRCQNILMQISFLVICYPVLIVTYLGQAAWLTRYPDQVSSTFYASIPYGDGFYWVRATSLLAWFVVSLLLDVWLLLLTCRSFVATICKDYTCSFLNAHGNTW